MTQSPLGHDPSQPGPFDGPGPGEPDLPTTQQDLTTTQGASLPDDPALSPTAYPGEDAGTTTTPVGGTGHTGGAYPPGGVGPDAGVDVSGGNAATDRPSTSSSSDTGSRTDAAKGEAKQVAGHGGRSGQAGRPDRQGRGAERGGRDQAAGGLVASTRFVPRWDRRPGRSRTASPTPCTGSPRSWAAWPRRASSPGR